MSAIGPSSGFLEQVESVFQCAYDSTERLFTSCIGIRVDEHETEPLSEHEATCDIPIEATHLGLKI